VRLVELKAMERDVYTLLVPNPSLRLNPDGVEVEAANPQLLIPYSIEVLRLDIMGQFYPYSGLTLFDPIDAVRRIFKLACLKADKCLVSARSKRENMEVSAPSVQMSISLVKEFAPGEGRIWMEGGLLVLQ
jgi:hypothetical protein